MTYQNRYSQIIESIFFNYYVEGAETVEFERQDIVRAAHALGIQLPKNLGDVIYSFRYRAVLPESVRAKASTGMTWIIRPAGRARYRFVLISDQPLVPREFFAQTKIPDSTPSIVARYALSDEQALLARVRYNRLIDVFTGVACYSLQNHLRTSVPELGQVETDEIYVGVDHRGVQYVFPIQAKGGNDRLNIVQIEQDFAVCAYKFPDLICRAIAAQFMTGDVIALFSFEISNEGVALVDEKHYLLVPSDEISPEELLSYRRRSTTR
jgi:hypothetical protein